MRSFGLSTLGFCSAVVAASLASVPASAATPLATFLSRQHVVRAAASGDTVRLTVALPLRNRAELEQFIAVASNRHSPMWKHWLTPQQFAARYAPLPADVARVEATLRAEGLTVTGVHGQLIRVSTTAATASRVFRTPFAWVRDRSGTFIAARGAAVIPAELNALRANVIGLEALPHPETTARISPLPANRYGPLGGSSHGYLFDDLKQAYGYPSYASYNGAGRNIAIVGAGNYNQADVNTYFNGELLGGTGALDPVPTVQLQNYGGAPFTSNPSNPNFGVSVESNLDVQQSAGSAPGSVVTLISVPGFNQDFLDAYEGIAEQNLADVVSTSYGECELFFTSAYSNFGGTLTELQNFDDAFMHLAAEGTTVVFSSGDEAGEVCPNTTDTAVIPSVGIWVDDPNVVAVGGTNLKTSYSSGSLASTYVAENAVADYRGGASEGAYCYAPEGACLQAWWGSGGGVSAITTTFSGEPSYQTAAGLSLSGRGVPDVAMHMGGYFCQAGVDYCNDASPYPAGYYDTHDLTAVGGTYYQVSGTSASAPEFAGLVAVLDQAAGGRLGNVDYWLYDFASNGYGAFHQSIPSFNGVNGYGFSGPGWTPVTGVGTPNVEGLFALLGVTTVPAAGNPQTASNP